MKMLKTKIVDVVTKYFLIFQISLFLDDNIKYDDRRCERRTVYIFIQLVAKRFY